MIKKNCTHSHNFKDTVELVADCGAKEISSHLLTALKNANNFHHCMSQSTLKLCLIISSNHYWKIHIIIYILFIQMRQVMQLAIYATF